MSTMLDNVNHPLVKLRIVDNLDTFAELVVKAAKAADEVYEASVQRDDKSADALLNDPRLEALWDLEAFFEGWIDN